MKNLKSAILISALLIAGLTFTTSCTNKVKGDGNGYVTLTLNNPDVEILTKADVVDDSYNVVISKNSSVVKNDTYAALKTKFPLEPGDYVIYAQNITEDAALTSREGRGAQRFYGESSFSIEAGVDEQVTFTCTMVNARVSVDFDQTFKQVFKSAEVTVYESSNENRKITFPYSSAVDSENLWGYFNIDSDPEMIVVVSFVRNDDVPNNYTARVPLVAQTWHKINIKSNSTNGQADLEIYVNDQLAEEDVTLGVDPY